MAPDRAVYLMRAGEQMLVADCLCELAELIECAHDSDDHIELLLAYYPGPRPLERCHLEELLAALHTSP